MQVASPSKLSLSPGKSLGALLVAVIALTTPAESAPAKPARTVKSVEKSATISPAHLPPESDPVPLPGDVPPHLAVPPHLGGQASPANPSPAQPAAPAPIAAPASPPVPASPAIVTPLPSSGLSVPALPASSTYAREPKLALVIGNGSYREAPLANPVNDARAVSLRLQQLGFTVIKKENGTREEMLKAVREFGNQLKNGGVGLFYFAGHGIQSRGANYLIPVDADIASEDELNSRAYNLSEVIEKMDVARNRLNIVVLDACRNNPFARSFRSASRGLARIDQSPTGMLIAYATAPGATAADGTSGNGLYSEQFLRVLAEPGLKLEELFRKVRVYVKEKSNGEQIPWEMSSVTGDFYFNPLPEQANATFSNTPILPPSATATPAAPRELAPVLLPKRLLESYQPIASIPVSGSPAIARFTGDGKQLALATPDNILRVIDTSQGNLVQTRPGFGRVSTAQDGKFMLGLGQGNIQLASIDDKLSLSTFQDLGDGIQLAAMTPRGKHILVHSARKGFRLLQVDTGQWVAQLGEVDGDPQYLFSPDGGRLLIWGSTGSNLKLWDLEKLVRISNLSSHWKPVTFARFSADSQFLFTASPQDRMMIWRTSDGDDLQRLSMPDSQPVPVFAEFIDDGKRILLSFRDGKLAVWDTSNGKAGDQLASDLVARHFRLSNDRNRLFASGHDGNLRVFDLHTLALVSALPAMELLELSSDGRRLMVRDSDGVRLLDAATLTPLGRMPGQVNAFVGKKAGVFATSSVDGKIALWDAETGDPLNQLKGHMDTVSHIQFSPDARHIASLGNDRQLKLWGLPDVQNVGQLTKDQFEATAEYQKRLANWASPYRVIVSLVEYNADTEQYTVKIGDVSLAIRIARDDARKLAGQKQALLEAQLKFFDSDNLLVSDSKLTRLP